MTLPTGIRGRLVALALLLIPAILLFNYVLWPLFNTYASAGEELEIAREEVGRYQRLLNQLPSLKAAAAKLDRTRPLAPYLLSGNNRALAAAGLQRRLQGAAEEHGVTLLSLRVQNPDLDGPLERISVEGRLRASAEQLRDLLYFIETTEPYLFVDDLSISVRHSGRRQKTTPGSLEVSLTLYGLRAPDGQRLAGGARG